MEPAVRDRLLALNRDFYAAVAEPFDETRRGWPAGHQRLLAMFPPSTEEHPLRVADIGCGNGRFARMLDGRGQPSIYVGVDGNCRLLEIAAAGAQHLAHSQATFVQADLAQPGWSQAIAGDGAAFDAVLCLSTLQHLPGHDLRRRVVADLCGLLAPQGLLAVSGWQFLSSPRLAARQVDWPTIGLSAGDVEPGDALLPWQQGVHALRYVHQIDAAEMVQLAAAANLTVRELFCADGKEGNLNLYAVLEPAANRALP